MKSAEIRSSFIEFFRARGHEVVRSASLIPDKDPTLLFTNAGMVPFKNVFLGNEERAIKRAVDAQKCLRLSGKHNDLEEVGRDTYHHTFFEMLGNWSFGDYYKREAITWAWELLTGVWKLPKRDLWATVYRTDDEAEALWKSETDIAHDRIVRFDEKDNFWEMGETGPCGPCSEIHIDRGDGTCDRRDVPDHVCGVNQDCARFIELWNLVFIQYNRIDADTLVDLEQKHVDTGAGLERLAMVLQGVFSNYDTDLFRALIQFAEEASGRRYGEDPTDDLAFRVVADHARALTFMIADGVQPGNEGRGYVLRRVLRRAARHARNLGFREPFLTRVTGVVVETMGNAYPEIVERRDFVERVVRTEEERFSETLEKGLQMLEQERAALEKTGSSVLPGAVAFRLYDTYGFPLDMTQDILRSDGLDVGTDGFDRCMDEQRRRARDARKGPEVVAGTGSFQSRFVGDRENTWESTVTALRSGAEEVEEARPGDEVQIIVPETPFYGESGGQVGDRGIIETSRGDRIEITDTQKPRGDLIVHVGKVLEGEVRRGDTVRLQIDGERREGARSHHSATHVLHALLRDHLGGEVRQAGSLVAPDRLRFDFTHPEAVSPAVLRRIEEQANERIRANDALTSEEMSYDDAIAAGALAFFGDKYGDRVRVVRIGDYSTELCGGTHVRRAGDIGVFKLRAEGGVAAGVRRIEAITGDAAMHFLAHREENLRRMAELLKSPEDEITARVERLLEQQKELERQIEQLRAERAGAQSADLLETAREIHGTKVLAAEVSGVDDKGMRSLADRLREGIGSGIVVLGTRTDGRALLLAAVTRDLTKKFHAGEIIKKIAPVIGGGGGGKPELAQAGGKQPERLKDALDAVYSLVD